MEDKNIEEMGNTNLKVGKIVGGALGGVTVGGFGGFVGGFSFGVLGGFIGFSVGNVPGAIIGGLIGSLVGLLGLGGIFGLSGWGIGRAVGYLIAKKIAVKDVPTYKIYQEFYAEKNEEFIEQFKEFIDRDENREKFSKFICPLSKKIVKIPVRHPNLDYVCEKKEIIKHLTKNPKGKNSPCKKRHMDIKKLYFDFDYYPKLLTELVKATEKKMDSSLMKICKKIVGSYKESYESVIKNIREIISKMHQEQQFHKDKKENRKIYNKIDEILEKIEEEGCKILNKGIKHFSEGKQKKTILKKEKEEVIISIGENKDKKKEPKL